MLAIVLRSVTREIIHTGRDADSWIGDRFHHVRLGNVLAVLPLEGTSGCVDEIFHAERHPHGVESQQLHATQNVHDIQAEGSGSSVEPIRRRLPVLCIATCLKIASIVVHTVR